MSANMIYSIEFFKTLDIPSFRVVYNSKYHTGSYPINSWYEAMEFIRCEFGDDLHISYAMRNLRTAVAEMIFTACMEMEAEKCWYRDDTITTKVFFNSYK